MDTFCFTYYGEYFAYLVKFEINDRFPKMLDERLILNYSLNVYQKMLL